MNATTDPALSRGSSSAFRGTIIIPACAALVTLVYIVTMLQLLPVVHPLARMAEFAKQLETVSHANVQWDLKVIVVKAVHA